MDPKSQPKVDQKKQTQIILGKAYDVFIKELGKHMSQFDTLFHGDGPPTRDDIVKASASFHTIKGGAGFFGLAQIAKAAAALENLLNDPNFSLKTDMEKVESLFDVLRKESIDLPKPEQIRGS